MVLAVFAVGGEKSLTSAWGVGEDIGVGEGNALAHPCCFVLSPATSAGDADVGASLVLLQVTDRDGLSTTRSVTIQG